MEGDDVYIPCKMTVKFNKRNFKFGNLIIDGVFKIDETLPEITIEAENIWVKSGDFLVGTKE